MGPARWGKRGLNRRAAVKPIGIFPFGQPVQEVGQTDRSPKDVFVLGVYASAVHARWINTENKTVIQALAVASEPYIFWRGEDAETIMGQINVPEKAGKLIPAKLNGRSGQALDELILHPLGIDRQKAWLCDLTPHCCLNSRQQSAIKGRYLPVAQKYGLPIPTVPSVPKAYSDENRRKAILEEVFESEASVLILLGDQPIKWFLSYYDKRWKKLSDFGNDRLSYGQLHPANLNGKEINILPLAHPRQIAKLGLYSPKWHDFHQTWLKQSASRVVK
jgi:uracil-DNA glycosylase